MSRRRWQWVGAYLKLGRQRRRRREATRLTRPAARERLLRSTQTTMAAEEIPGEAAGSTMGSEARVCELLEGLNTRMEQMAQLTVQASLGTHVQFEQLNQGMQAQIEQLTLVTRQVASQPEQMAQVAQMTMQANQSMVQAQFEQLKQITSQASTSLP